MSNLAIAEIEGVKYYVLDFELTTYQPEDSKGKKSGKVSSCRTTIEVEANDKLEFVEHAAAQPFTPIPSIRIALYKPHEPAEWRTYTATDSFLVYFKQKVDVYSDNPFTWILTFTSRKMEINGEVQELNWDTEV